ncbi:phage tail protein [Mucilaginibacter sp. RS28]|uniref:Phage tail protein n=1 Tax=Mucilaginibacter straminoryzae TaxID=2932774 RepID=A0A9X2BBI8_9SPHI|nr:phage tail protein [Mucilaginibacter straminoryzae]MCJ8208323.1 phage tail protein [Mucilaginibacter straminoryzae]
MADNYYPPVGFYFKVNVIGVSGSNEGNFQEVSGLNIKLETQEVKEGGENRYAHRLPSPPKFQNIVLKRGLTTSSALITWAKAAVEQFTFSPKTVVINLMDENASPLASWNIKNAYPVALQFSDFKAQENGIVIETIDLAFDYFTRTF